MPLEPDDIKRRIHAARLLRDISQTELNRLGAEDGFGREEMGRVERGELDFRTGKHLDPLCRYLNVPRWWFTAEDLYFGDMDAPASPDEVAVLLAHQNELLRRQSDILANIEKAIVREEQVKESVDERIARHAREIASPDRPEADAPDPKRAPRRRPGAKKSRAAKPQLR